MQIVALKKFQLGLYFDWYKFWHRKGFPMAMRCENIIAVEKDGELGAAIMVQAVQNSACCIFSVLVRNPYCDRDFSSEAVDFLIQNLGSFAKSMGYVTFVSLVGDEHAKARYQKNGIAESPEVLTLFSGVC